MATLQIDVDQIQTPTFNFQVAGHGALLKLPEGKISKPLIEIELAFYQIVQNHPTLLPFTAPFYGTLELTFTKEKLNEWYRSVEEQEQFSTSSSSDIKSREAESEAEENKKMGREVVINPWSLKVSKDSLSNMLSNAPSSTSVFKNSILCCCSSSFFLSFERE